MLSCWDPPAGAVNQTGFRVVTRGQWAFLTDEDRILLELAGTLIRTLGPRGGDVAIRDQVVVQVRSRGLDGSSHAPLRTGVDWLSPAWAATQVTLKFRSSLRRQASAQRIEFLLFGWQLPERPNRSGTGHTAQ